MWFWVSWVRAPHRTPNGFESDFLSRSLFFALKCLEFCLKIHLLGLVRQPAVTKHLAALSPSFPYYLSGPELSLLRVEVLQLVPVRAISSFFARRGTSHDTPTSTVLIPDRCNG